MQHEDTHAISDDKDQEMMPVASASMSVEDRVRSHAGDIQKALESLRDGSEHDKGADDGMLIKRTTHVYAHLLLSLQSRKSMKRT